MILLNYSSNSWRTLEILLIDYEIVLMLSWYANLLHHLMFLQTKQQDLQQMIQIFKVPVVTLSRQDKSKLLQQLKSDF